jgi:hypothetical protein
MPLPLECMLRGVSAGRSVTGIVTLGVYAPTHLGEISIGVEGWKR